MYNNNTADSYNACKCPVCQSNVTTYSNADGVVTSWQCEEEKCVMSFTTNQGHPLQYDHKGNLIRKPNRAERRSKLFTFPSQRNTHFTLSAKVKGNFNEKKSKPNFTRTGKRGG